VTFKNVVVQGNTGSAHSTHGLIVDGRVNTLSAYKLYLNEMDGAGLWFRNTMCSAAPEFATFYGLEIERPFFEAVQIAAGNRFYFTDAQLFGSATRTNVTIAPRVTSDGAVLLPARDSTCPASRSASTPSMSRATTAPGSSSTARARS